MYDDDQHEKEAARNQLIVFVMLAAMMMLWLHYYGPKPQQAQPTQTEIVPQQTPSAKAVALETAEVPEATGPGTTVSGWPNLPPIPAESNPIEDEIVLKKDDTELVFTRVGARLKRASLMLGEHGDSRVQLVPEAETPDSETVYPFGLRFSNDALRDELDRRRFDVEKRDATSVSFVLTLPNAAIVRKTFTLGAKPHVVTATIEYTNLEPAPRVLGRDQDPAYTFTWGPNIASGDLKKGVQQAAVWRTDGVNGILGTASMKPDKNGAAFTRRFPGAEWLGVRSAYFIVAIKPDAGGDGWIIGDPHEFRFGYMVPRTEIAPGQTQRNSFDVYIGPSHLPHLKQAWPTLATSLRFFDWGLFDWFAKLLLQLLNWFYGVIPNYGVAIVLLTVVVRLVMFPLTIKQMTTMKRMQLLAPEMEKIKEQYGNDQQEMQRRMMELYREYGMNPAAGCLPMFLQLPVFISLYRMLWSAYELRGAHFALWIKDLSEPDRLMHIPALANLPWIFSHLQDVNVLPLLSALAMLASVKLTPMSGPVQNPQQKMMMTIMPVVFSLFCYPLASGLNLYILTSTVLGIAQSYALRFHNVEPPEKVKPKKKQHFYTAAIEKKKQAEREMKERKRKEKMKGGEGA